SIKTNSFVEQIVCSQENSSCMYGECDSCQMKIPSTEIPKLYPQIDLDEDLLVTGTIICYLLPVPVTEIRYRLPVTGSGYPLPVTSSGNDNPLPVTGNGFLLPVTVTITGKCHPNHRWSKFITHSYITNAQFDFIGQLKESLASDTAITSHGKEAIDGLGAVVKSAARRETMRAGSPEKSFLTPIEFYNFSKQKFAPKCLSTTTIQPDSTIQQQKEVKIHIWYLSGTEIKQHFEKYLSGRWEARSCTGPINGSISAFQHFQAVDNQIIRCKITSNARLYQDFSIVSSQQRKFKHVKNVLMINDVKIGDYVVVEYDESWWLAIIQDIELNLKELKVSFLHPSGPRVKSTFRKNVHEE
ncbi:unnamed protein product, partial [Didymodactylos carnosus]